MPRRWTSSYPVRMSKRKGSRISTTNDDGRRRERRSATVSAVASGRDSRAGRSKRPEPSRRKKQTQIRARRAAAVVTSQPTSSDDDDDDDNDDQGTAIDADDNQESDAEQVPSGPRTTRSTVRQAAAATSGAVADVCNVCGKLFKGVAELERHLEVHSEQHPFQCPLCNVKFKYKRSIERHIISDHKYPDAGRNSPLPPSEVISARERRHLEHYGPDVRSDELPSPRKRKLSAVLEMETESGTVAEAAVQACPSTTVAMPDPLPAVLPEVADPVVEESKIKDDATAPETATTSSTNNTTEKPSKKHRKEAGKKRKRNKSKRGSEKLSGINLDPVGQVGSALSQEAAAEAPFPVGLDGFVSALVNDAKYRDLRLHMQALRRTCPFCGKVCLKPSDLNRHKRIHTGEQPWKCNLCDRRFKAKRSMQYHLRSVHGATVELSPALEGKFFNTKKYRRRYLGQPTTDKRQRTAGDRTETSSVASSSVSAASSASCDADKVSGAVSPSLTFANAFVKSEARAVETVPSIPEVCAPVGTSDPVETVPKHSLPVSDEAVEKSKKKRKSKREQVPPPPPPMDDFSDEDDLPLVPKAEPPAHVPRPPAFAPSEDAVATAIAASPMVTRDCVSILKDCHQPRSKDIVAQQPIEIVAPVPKPNLPLPPKENFIVSPAEGSPSPPKDISPLPREGAPQLPKDRSLLLPNQSRSLYSRTGYQPARQEVAATPAHKEAALAMNKDSILLVPKFSVAASIFPDSCANLPMDCSLPTRKNVPMSNAPTTGFEPPSADLKYLATPLTDQKLLTVHPPPSTFNVEQSTSSLLPPVVAGAPEERIDPPSTESQVFNIASFRDPDAPDGSATIEYRVQSHTAEVLVSRVVGVSLTDGEKKFLYKCHWCSKVFLSLGKMQSHLTAHLRKAQKTYTCASCNQLFQLKSRLRLHVCEARRAADVTMVPSEQPEQQAATLPTTSVPDVVPLVVPNVVPLPPTVSNTVLPSSAEIVRSSTTLITGHGELAEKESFATTRESNRNAPEETSGHPGLPSDDVAMTVDDQPVPVVPFTSPLSISVGDEADDEAEHHHHHQQRQRHLDRAASVADSSSFLSPQAMQVSEDGSRVGYRCHFCTKMFDRLFSLHRHERIHTGVKPCFCLECGRGFSEPRNLRHHQIRFHSDGSERHLLRRERHAAAAAAAASSSISSTSSATITVVTNSGSQANSTVLTTTTTTTGSHHQHHQHNITGGRIDPLYSPNLSSSAEKRISYLKKSAIRILNAVSSSSPPPPPFHSARSSPSLPSSFSDTSPCSSGSDQASGGEHASPRQAAPVSGQSYEHEQQQHRPPPPSSSSPPPPSSVDGEVRRPAQEPINSADAAPAVETSGGAGQTETAAAAELEELASDGEEADDDRVTVTVIPTDVPDVIPRTDCTNFRDAPDEGHVSRREILSDPKRSLMGNLRKQQFRSSLTRAVNLVLAKSSDKNGCGIDVASLPCVAVTDNNVESFPPPDVVASPQSGIQPSLMPQTMLQPNVGSPPPPLLLPPPPSNVFRDSQTSFLVSSVSPPTINATNTAPIHRQSPPPTSNGRRSTDSLDSCEALSNSSDGQTGNLCSWKLLNDVSSVISPISPPECPEEVSVRVGSKRKRGNNSYFSTYSPRLNVVNKPVSRLDACKPQILPDGRMVFTCFYCHKTFPSASDVNRHMDFHEDVRPYKCNFCDYFSRTNSQLKVHMMRHQGIKQYLCEMCHYYGVTQSDLNRHKKTQAHCLRTQNVCQLCGLGYFTRQQKVTHMLTVHLGLIVPPDGDETGDHEPDDERGLAAAAAEEEDEELRQRLIQQEALIAAATQGNAIDLSVAAAALADTNLFSRMITLANSRATNGGGHVSPPIGDSGSDDLPPSGDEEEDDDSPVDFSVLKNNSAANGQPLAHETLLAGASAMGVKRKGIECKDTMNAPPAHQQQRTANCFRVSITKENYDCALTTSNGVKREEVSGVTVPSSINCGDVGYRSTNQKESCMASVVPSLVRIRDRSNRKSKRHLVAASFLGQWSQTSPLEAAAAATNGGLGYGRTFVESGGGNERR